MNTMKWEARTGKVIELKASAETTMHSKYYDLDGDMIFAGKEALTGAKLELCIDGELVKSCLGTSFGNVVKVQDGIWTINGLGVVGFGDNRAEEVKKFLSDTMENGKSEEVKKAEQEEMEKKADKLIEEAREIIEKAKTTAKNTDGTLMDSIQAKIWLKLYNNLYNEGGDGYLPEVITKEKYDWAKKILSY